MHPYRSSTRFVAALALLSFALALPASAQTVGVGADVVSRYVWRGQDFGESLSIQPTLEVSSGPVTFGTWASYSVSADGSAFNEHDLYLSTTAGPVTFGITDYYFPSVFDEEDGDFGFFNYAGDGEGAHILEPFVSFTGPEGFPVTLYGALNVHNDPDNSAYLEVSYPWALNGTELGFMVGATPGESALYGTDGFAIINVGLTATHKLQLTEQFALPLSVGYVLNPDQERSFLVFGLSL